MTMSSGPRLKTTFVTTHQKGMVDSIINVVQVNRKAYGPLTTVK